MAGSASRKGRPTVEQTSRAFAMLAKHIDQVQKKILIGLGVVAVLQVAAVVLLIQ